MKTCLVVDDSGVVRKIARRILEAMQFAVIEAEDGAVALEACKRAMPDAVLLDWNMPVMDGFEFLVQLRRMAGVTRRRWCSAPPKTASITSRARCMPAPTSTS